MPRARSWRGPHAGLGVAHPLSTLAFGLSTRRDALSPATSPALLPLKNKRKPFSEPPHSLPPPESSLLAPAVATVRSGVLGNCCYGDPVLQYCTNVSHLSPYLVWG